MISGNLSNWKNHGQFTQERFKKAFEFLQDKDLHTLAEGTYQIDGKRVYASVMLKETQPLEMRSPEAHNKYIDIQCVIEGIEKIGFIKRSEHFSIAQNRLEEKDLLLFEKEIDDESFVILKNGDYAVFFPEDIHRPLCEHGKAGTVKKVVVKILVDAL